MKKKIQKKIKQTQSTRRSIPMIPRWIRPSRQREILLHVSRLRPSSRRVPRSTACPSSTRVATGALHASDLPSTPIGAAAPARPDNVLLSPGGVSPSTTTGSSVVDESAADSAADSSPMSCDASASPSPVQYPAPPTPPSPPRTRRYKTSQEVY
jgi:hypothetical protein